MLIRNMYGNTFAVKYRDDKRFDPLRETVFVKNCVPAQYLRFLFAEYHISMICERPATYTFRQKI